MLNGKASIIGRTFDSTLPASDFAQKSLEAWHRDALAKDAVPDDEMMVIGYAMDYLDRLALPSLELLDVLRRWIPEIARYSFREVRMQRI